MSLRARLYLVGAAVVIVLMVPAVLGVTRLVELRQIAFDLKTRHAEAYLVTGRLETSLAELNRLQRSYVALPGPEVRQRMYDELLRAENQLSRLRLSGYGAAAETEGAIVDSLRAATERIDGLIQRGRVGEATTYFDQIKPLFVRAQASLSRLAEVIDERSTAEAARAEAISSTMARTTGLAYGVALFIAVLVGALAIGGFTALLRHLREAMAKVAAGRFVPPEGLPYDREDEVGDLCRSFRTMAEQLAELDRLKAEFVSIASHELKTPVSVIEGYAEMLEDGLYGPVTGKQVQTLRYIQEQTGVLAERVNQLLSLSRLEARGLELKPMEVDPRSLVEGVRQAFGALAAQKGIRFVVEAEPSLPASVELDPDQVRHELLGNLISNAFKFTPSGGRVRVRAAGRDGYLSIQVRDTGEGIPPAQLPYIFEKYYQAGSHAGKVGTGLGLAIAREVAEAHGGTIEVESRPGEGTSFEVLLPITQPGRDGDGRRARPRGVGEPALAGRESGAPARPEGSPDAASLG